MDSNFINRSISFFTNKKKILIISLSIIILFIVGFLYNTYATSTGVALGNEENTYDILLTDSTNTVTVPAKSSKTVYYQFSNTNKGTVKYYIGYSSNNVIAKVWWDTEDKVSDTIEYGEYKFIKLKLINDTTEDDTITIKSVLGFVNGGDVIPDDNTTLVTGKIKQTNTMSITPSTALSTLGIAKTAVEEITFVNDNIVPEDALGSTTVSSDNSIILWYTASDTEGMYKVYIGSDNGITSFPADCTSLFEDFTKTKVINFNNIDTSKVTNMQRMFTNCSSLKSLDVSNFDTSNVENMYYMFYNCRSITELDLDSFYTPKLKGGLQGTFANCTKLKKLSFKNIDTSRITSMQSLFQSTSNLIDVDLRDLNTSRVSNMSQMFRETKLSQISIDTSSATKMSGMFQGSTATSLDLSTFDTSKVSDMSSMFNGVKNVSNLDLSNFKTPRLTNASRMFYNTSIRKLNLSNLTFGTTNINEMFGNRNLTLIDMRNADFSNVTYSAAWNIFSQVPKTATIYLKDTEFNRTFMTNNYSTYTNVQFIPGE